MQGKVIWGHKPEVEIDGHKQSCNPIRQPQHRLMLIIQLMLCDIVEHDHATGALCIVAAQCSRTLLRLNLPILKSAPKEDLQPVQGLVI